MRNRWIALALGVLAFASGEAFAAETPKAGEGGAAPKIKRTEIIAAENWTITCTVLDQPGAKRRCSSELRLAQTESNSSAPRVVFTWIVGMQDGKPMSGISVPSGVMIAPGVQVKIGEKEPRTYSFLLCQPDHCEALMPLDESVTKALLAASSAEFTVIAVNGSPVKFNAGLKGIEESLAMVSK